LILFKDKPEVLLSFFNSILGKDDLGETASCCFGFSVLTTSLFSFCWGFLGITTGIGVMPLALK